MRGDARGGGEGTSTRGDVPAGGEGASVRGEARGGGEGTSTRGDVPGGGEGASLRAAAQPGEEGTSERTASRADADGWVVAAGALRDAARLAALAGAGRPLLLETAALDAPELDRVLLALSEQGAPPLALLHAPGPRIGSRGRADQMTVGATLAQMRELQSAFGLVTGFAATEPAFAVAAAALEAPLVELAVDLGDRAQLTLVAAALRAIGNLTAAEPATDGAA